MIFNNNQRVADLFPTIIKGTLLRVILIVWSSSYESIADQQLGVTDIDYKVYTDAIMTPNCINPYLCHHTYRYSPLLSYLMVFNIPPIEYMGKIFFALFDVLAMLGLANLIKPQHRRVIVQLYSYNPLFIYLTVRGSCESISLALMFWTWFFIFGTNGNAILNNNSPKNINKENNQTQKIIGYCLYGLWVHFRVYPIIFLPLIMIHERQIC